MDYEKKYKEAQKWIESIYPELSHEQQMEAEAFFPELQESENERTRKEIISFLQLPHKQFVGERKQEKWIAWLEKQGVYREILSFINSLDVLTLDNIKEMENQAFMHGIEVERNKNIFKDNKEIKI